MKKANTLAVVAAATMLAAGLDSGHEPAMRAHRRGGARRKSVASLKTKAHRRKGNCHHGMSKRPAVDLRKPVECVSPFWDAYWAAKAVTQ